MVKKNCCWLCDIPFKNRKKHEYTHVIVEEEIDENGITRRKKLEHEMKVCKDCLHSLEENPTVALWKFGSKCSSCSMPFGLRLPPTDKYIMRADDPVEFEGKNYTVCKTCKLIIAQEIKKNVQREIDSIEKIQNIYLNEYRNITGVVENIREMREEVKIKVDELSSMKFDFAIQHLRGKKGKSK